jgi:ATP-dependent DNA ligase
MRAVKARCVWQVPARPCHEAGRPSSALNPSAGDGWIHEIKLDGFRVLARRHGAGVRLLTRRGIDWTTVVGVEDRAHVAQRVPGDGTQLIRT